jgi:hypothetical protein
MIQNPKIVDGIPFDDTTQPGFRYHWECWFDMGNDELIGVHSNEHQCDVDRLICDNGDPDTIISIAIDEESLIEKKCQQYTQKTY